MTAPRVAGSPADAPGPEPGAPGPGHPQLGVCLVGPSLDILGGQAVQLERLRLKLTENPALRVGFVPINPRFRGPWRRLQQVRYVRTIVNSVAYVVELFRSLGSYDVVHAFSASYWSFVLSPLPAMCVGRLFGRGVILNYRSGEADDHLTRWRVVVNPAMRLAHRIVVPSGYLVDVFARHGFEATAIPNFVDVERIPYRDRPAPRPVFLSNRNLEPMYNVGLVVRAFARIQEAIPDARLIIAGDGRERSRLRDMVESLSLRNVDFRGRTPPEAMGRLYDEADVYLNAPNIDNMPNSILEAFAAGLPVVTTSAGGIPYIVRHDENGAMVDCEDADALAREAIRMVRDPARAHRLASEARAECLRRYVWEAVSGSWERLYREVAALGAQSRRAV